MSANKCACQMTGLEILEDTLQISKPQKTILIVDTGRGWTVTMFGPDNAGDPAPNTHITIQSAIERTETLMAELRRQPDRMTVGYVVSDAEEVAKELLGQKI